MYLGKKEEHRTAQELFLAGLSALYGIALQPFCFLHKLFPCLLVCSESAAQQRAMDLTLC